MAGQLERNMWEFNSYIKGAELRKKFQELYEEVVAENENNVIAFIPVGKVDTETLDISGMEYCTDYTILSGARIFEGDEIDTEEEYQAILKKKADEEFSGWRIEKCEDDDYYNLLDIDGDVHTECDTAEEAQDELDSLKEEWIDEQDSFDDLDIVYHEVYWNRTWRFNGELDQDIADRVGLGYLQHEESGDEYLFLLGCGMDLTPKIIAYQALAHGYIDEAYLRYFQGDLSYTKDVMGKAIWNEVVEKLGISRFFNEGTSV